MVQEQNLSLDDVFALHVRAFQIMVAQRKTTELKQLFDEIVRLDKRGLRFDEPDTFYMASRFAYALTALGEFGYATSLGKIYDEFRVLEGDKPIPKRAFMYFSISESFIRAFRGEKPLADAFSWAQNNDEKAALESLFYTFATLNSDRNQRIKNAKRVNETLMLGIAGKSYDPLMTKFALAALLEFYAATGQKLKHQMTLQRLASQINKEMRTDNYLGVGKNLTFIDRTIADHAMLFRWLCIREIFL